MVCLHFRRKWRLVYIALMSIIITGCLVIFTSVSFMDQSSRNKLNGNWNFKKVIREPQKIFKIKDHFLWAANDKSIDDYSFDADDVTGILGDDDDSITPMNATLVQKMLQYPEREYTERVLILSPIHNVENVMLQFGEILKSFTYPHKLVSIAFGEDSSTDNTLFIAKMVALDLAKHFHNARALHLNLTGGINGDWSTIHDELVQFRRRQHLADARNMLLHSALTDEDWVLWIDSDVAEIPRDIIQQLLSAQRPVVAPSCVMIDREFGHKRIYDKNTWRETRKSLKMLQELHPSRLVLEGYGPSHRVWLSHLREEGRVVPLDGVGGCTLLVKADCHRKGLKFPNQIYKNHIETEGLAKLAKDMGFKVVGMPFVEVVHS